jgi:hypothetical protein
MWAESTAGVEPTGGDEGVREESAEGDGDGIDEADGDLMLPVVLRPAPGEGIVKASEPGSSSTRLAKYRWVRRLARMWRRRRNSS